MTLKDALCLAMTGVALAIGGKAVAADVPSAPPAAGAAASETAQYIRYTRELESFPQQPEGEEKRVWLVRWLVETPDYTVKFCPVLGLQPQVAAASPIAAALTVQQGFGNLVYQIEHGAQGDELSRQLAGVESALRAYERYLAADTTLRLEAFDVLASQQRAGTLRAYLAPIVEKECDAAKVTGKLRMVDGQARAVPDMPFLGGYVRESHIVYPLLLDGWVAQGEQRYDTPDLGVSVRFQKQADVQRWIDVFFYPMGVVTADQVEALAVGEHRQLLDVFKNPASRVTEVDAAPLSTVPLPVSGSTHDTPSGHLMAFSMTRDGRNYSSVMLFTVDRMYAIKLRYSVEAALASPEQATQELLGFAGHLLPQLDISSSGECGAPERAQAGVMPAGCVGTESTLPEVGEGQREIRFEYAAPAKPAG